MTFLQTSLAHSIHGKEQLLKEIAECKNKTGFVCPHCQNKNVIRIGTYKTTVGSVAWFRFLEIEGFEGPVKNLKNMMITFVVLSE